MFLIYHHTVAEQQLLQPAARLKCISRVWPWMLRKKKLSFVSG